MKVSAPIDLHVCVSELDVLYILYIKCVYTFERIYACIHMYICMLEAKSDSANIL